jgi:hypothetical protein
MEWDRKTAVVLVAVLLIAVSGLAVAQTVSKSGSQGVAYETSDGVRVVYTDDQPLPSRPSAGTVELGNLTVTGSDAAVGIGSGATGGSQIDVTDVDVQSGGSVTLARSDLGYDITVESGDANVLQARDYALDDGTEDVAYDSDNGMAVTFDNLQSGITVAAVDADTGDPLDTTTTGSNGVATFELPSGQRSVVIQTTPADIVVYNELNPDELVDGNVTLRARIFGEGDTVIERNVTDGTLSLDGVPTDERLVITVKANNSEWSYRRILLESAIQSSEIYLLPANATSAQVEYVLDDQTGRFPPDSTNLFIEKPITRNGTTKYRVITGDRIGAGGSFPATLVDEERYRIRVENDQGETRVLGAYTVTGDERVLLPIGEVQLTADVSEGPGMQASLREAPDSASHDWEVRMVYLDPEGKTDEIEVSMTNSSGARIRPTTTETLNGTTSAYVETYPLNTSFNPEQDTVTVTVEAQRGLETVTFERVVGDLPNALQDAPIDPYILELMGFVSILAVFGLLVIVSPPLAALVGSGWAGLLTLLGVVPIPMPAVVLAGLVGILATVGTQTGVIR